MTHQPPSLRRRDFQRLGLGISLGLGLGLTGLSSHAQTFPGKMMSLVVPYPAGGPSDFLARQIQPELTKQLGGQQAMIVDNIGGVGGALGVQKLLNQPADGHTLILATPMELVLAPLSLSSVKHKPEDVKLAAVLVNTTMIMLGRKDLPGNTVDEVVEAARKAGAKGLTYGSVGPGSLYHLVAESFAQQAGLKNMVHVPYKGAAPLLTDLMGGQIDLVFMPLSGGVPALIKEGKVKAYGVASKQPHPLFPHLPTLTASKALENFEFDLWAGIEVHKQTPDAVIDKLNHAVYQALQNPEIRKAYESTGNVIPKPATPAELQRFYATETSRYQAIAKSINLQAL